MQAIDVEFLECTDIKHSRCAKSKYDSKQVPKRMFLQDPDNPKSKICKSCFDCRSYGRKIKNNRKERMKKKKDSTINSEYGFCPSIMHISLSDYPRDKVPKELFRKNSEDVNSKTYINCSDCRKYNSQNVADKVAILKKECEEFQDDEFSFCPFINHPAASEYPRDQVPKEMFRKFINDPRSPLYENCSDCRDYTKTPKYEWQERERNKTLENEFYCSACHKNKPTSDRANNVDGTPSSSCLSCKEKQKIYRLESEKIIEKIMKEFITKNGCSCQKCKKIYLKPKENTKYAAELNTYENGEKRYVTYQGIEYLTTEFLIQFEYLLELRFLEFDHLTEEEQRKRGLLKDDEVFVPKRDDVSQLKAEASIRLEALKTQLICARCHIEETIRREKGTGIISGDRLKKQEYVSKIKEKGCSVCGFYDPKLLRFLEFDHHDPSKKVAGVSIMMVSSEYNMDILTKECDETVTRVICKHCHQIHTDEQRKAGIIFYKS